MGRLKERPNYLNSGINIFPEKESANQAIFWKAEPGKFIVRDTPAGQHRSGWPIPVRAFGSSVLYGKQPADVGERIRDLELHLSPTGNHCACDRPEYFAWDCFRLVIHIGGVSRGFGDKLLQHGRRVYDHHILAAAGLNHLDGTPPKVPQPPPKERGACLTTSPAAAIMEVIPEFP